MHKACMGIAGEASVAARVDSEHGKAKSSQGLQQGWARTMPSSKGEAGSSGALRGGERGDLFHTVH